MKKRLFKLALAAALLVPLSVFGLLPNLPNHKNSGFDRINTVATERPDKGSLPPSAISRQRDKNLVSPSDYSFRSKALRANAPVVSGSAPVFGCNLVSPFALLSLPTDGQTTQPSIVSTDENFNANGGGVCDGNTYYSISYFKFGTTTFATIYKFDAETWEYTGLKNANISVVSTDMAYDPVTEKIYGCFNDNSGTGYVFGTLAPNDAQRNAIKNLDTPWNACAIAKDGTLYAIDMEGCLFTVNKATGDMTSVGDTGIKPCYTASAAIDHRSGRFYWTAAPENSNPGLYEVNPTTAEATLLYDLPENYRIAGLYIPIPEADDNAPDAPYSLQTVFENGSTEGFVSFIIPKTTFSGSPLEGTISYTVYISGPESNSITGSATPGETVSVPLSLSKSGQYEFKVVLSNASGDGPAATSSAFVGSGRPNAVTISSLEFADGRATLRWEAVTESADGGYFDPSAVTYTVRRYPADIVVASGTKQTEFTEYFEDGELTVHYYTISADYNGSVSEATESDRFVTGSAAVPYLENFDNSDALAAYTTVDGNNDGTTWEFYESRVRMKYNMREAMDDWLITPPVRLKKGWTYRFAFSAAAHNDSDPERLEASFGQKPTADGMTEQLIAPTVIAGKTPVTLESFVSVSADGLYYFGIHGISDKDKYYLYIDDISVSENFSNDVPAAPSDFKVSPSLSGELTVDIEITAPDKTLADDNLQSISSIILERDGEIIHTFTSVSPGAVVKYTDNNATQGPHTYSTYAVNTAGDGQKSSKRVYVGINIPSAPPSATLVENATPGEVTISWEIPGSDIEGNPINPELISYRIVTQDDNGDIITVADDVKGNSYTYQAIPSDGKQDLVVYAVHAKTSAGESEDFAKTPMIFAGPDYTLPFAESFPGGHLGEYVFGINTINGTYAGWALSTEMSQDGDGGCIGFIGQYRGDEATLYTGKISLRTATAPVLQFYYYAATNSTSTLKILIDDYTGEGYKTVRTITMNESGNDGWVKETLALDEYRGHTVSIMFDATVGSHNAVVIDNIKVINRPQHDLIASAISAPAKVTAGSEMTISVAIENFGAQTASDYIVELLCNGEKVAEKAGQTLESGQTVSLEFNYPVSVVSAERLNFEARIIYSPDENPDNNTTETMCTIVDLPNYPRISNLKAEVSGNDIVLTWAAPDLSTAIAAPVTEDFESYTPWSTTGVGQWLLIDRDGCRTAGVVDEISGQITSFFVYDNTSKDPVDYAAHSGHNMMASAYVIDEKGTQSDDWMISPLLPGCAQKISFFARSQRSTYPESFEVLYSTGSTEPDDFISLAKYTDISDSWTDYSVELPEGALRFAIRGISDDCYILFIDDITFIPADAEPEELQILGYNVYRNGTLISDNMVSETNFTDRNTPAGIHSYMVSVVYDKGESAPSEAVSAETSTIGSISSSDINIYSTNGLIIVENAVGTAISVYTPDGKTISTTEGNDHTEIPVSKGFYMVRVGSVTAKVAVR